MAYRLGIDIGANSIGWCCLRLDETGAPSGILDAGVRIYPDGRNPKDGSSLAAARRQPRAMRRNRDRYLRRRRNLLNALTRLGLMPADSPARNAIAALDPYTLRAAALSRRLEPHELGRVIFHLNQRRGFKSNRKADRGGDNESGLIRTAARELDAQIKRDGHATLGALLAARHARREGVRVRLAGSGKAAAYPFYPLREMVEAEFDTIWQAQAGWNAALSDAMRDDLKRIIFHQRALKSPPVGKCWLEPGEPRAFRAMPTAQAFRIAQDLAHLRISEPGMPERALDDMKRAQLRSLLLRGKDLTFDQLRKKLGLAAETDFNLASSRRDKLVGAETADRLGSKKVVGDAWHRLTLEQQNAAVAQLLESESDEAAEAALVALGLDPEAAKRAVGVGLPEGTASLSLKAMQRILPHLEKGLRYDEAVQAAGYAHHSDQRTGEVQERLPYYGELLHERLGTGTLEPDDPTEKRWGRAPNPTVHVALNELRRVVNTITERHGAPAEIVIETLRELGRSKEQRREYEHEQRKNQDANKRRRALLAKMGVRINGDNLMRLRLWEEQAHDPRNRVCPYSGRIITARMALSDEIEEDHILPFAITLDPSAANRVLVTREANRAKARRSPFEAFGHTPQWSTIQESIKHLPQNKRWRFEPDAMQKLAKDQDFLARHLNDSATIAKLARMYLKVLVAEQGKDKAKEKDNLWSTPGRLTALLRSKLGLNSDTVLGRGGARKDRTDHRHHAIDAVVVALTDRSLLQRVSTAAGRSEDARNRLVGDLGEPWPGFVAEAAGVVRRIVVSYKPDTGWQGALHNDTAYGPLRANGKKDPNVVVRRPLDSLADWKPADVKQGVRDPVLAAKVAAALDTKDKAARKQNLLTLTHSGGHRVRRVRTVERLDKFEAIRDRTTGNPYKLVKLDSNHRAELWRLPGGKTALTVVSTLDAAREALALAKGEKPAKDLRPHPAAKLLMRLHVNDALAFGFGNQRRIFVVQSISTGDIEIFEHYEANVYRRGHDRDDPYKRIRYGSASAILERGGRKIYVDPAGRVFDPGPPK
ncbi:MAG: type II CRISPR RNA-guided endonuclease Cas9 [Alphaproteobacteria bacterium]|nr:type II CRISPR RNA-guided endonuclease Cas9 [Alphaproteobacteria bacterium]